MKVATRLWLGFGVVIAMLVVILVMGISVMGSMSRATQEIVSDRYVATALIADVTKRVMDNTRQLRNMVLVDDPVKVEAFRQTFDKNKTENSESLIKLDKLLSLPKGRELFNVIAQSRNALSDKYTVYFELIKKDRKAAIDFLLGQIAPTNNAYIKALDDLSAFQAQLMNESAKKSEESYASAMTLMIGLGVIATLLAGFIALWIIRNLMKQLGGEPDYAAQAVGKIAQGDLSIDLEIKPGDSSSLLYSLKTMQDCRRD